MILKWIVYSAYSALVLFIFFSLVDTFSERNFSVWFYTLPGFVIFFIAVSFPIGLILFTAKK